MFYKNLKFGSVLAFLLVFSTISAQFVPCERSYTVFYDPFLKKMVEFKDFNGKIIFGYAAKIIPLSGTSFSPNAQELIKHNGKIYIFLAQTGFIFQMDQPQGDSVVFRKIDNTININYNIDCINFIYDEQIYNFGGNGFWSIYSHLRKFNKVDMEWDIQPTNIEVFSTSYNWFSPKEGRLYAPFQKIINKGIKDKKISNGVFDYTSYYLDIPTADWIKIGKLTPELIKLINQTNNYLGCEYDKGRIFVINDEVYLFDYINNKVYKSTKADLNQFFIRGALETTMFFYKGKLYKYQSGSETFKIWDFKTNDLQLLNFSIWGNDYMNLVLIFAIFFFIILIVLSIWFLNKSIRKKIEMAQLKVLKTKTMNQAFTETETSLIQLLINSNVAKKNVEIAEINHVLGIKDKNIGLQKKVRSDVINAINDKYIFITQGENNLIASVRKEDDKRFFEYFIAPNEVKTALKLIEKK